MYKTIKVLLVLATVGSAIELASLSVDYLEPRMSGNSEFEQIYNARADVRWRVYWFGGLAMAGIGFVTRRRAELAGLTLGIAGVYLMLLGNHGGLMGNGLFGPRFMTTTLTLVGLLLVMARQYWGPAPIPVSHSQGGHDS